MCIYKLDVAISAVRSFMLHTAAHKPSQYPPILYSERNHFAAAADITRVYYASDGRLSGTRLPFDPNQEGFTLEIIDN